MEQVVLSEMAELKGQIEHIVAIAVADAPKGCKLNPVQQTDLLRQSVYNIVSSDEDVARIKKVAFGDTSDGKFYKLVNACSNCLYPTSYCGQK